MRTRMWIAAAALCALAAPAAAAGNVTAVVDPVTRELRITGDDSANDIEITWDGTPGNYTVTGRDATTVNGDASFSATSARGVLVNFGAGDDRLAVTNANIRGALRIRGDEGNDAIVLNNVRMRQRTAIRGGAGDDSVAIIGGCSLYSLVFHGETGLDSIEAHNSEFRNRVRVDTGQMNDSMTFNNCDWLSQARFVVQARVGDDSLVIEGCDFDNRVEVDMGKDDDHVVLDGSDFDNNVDLDGGGGTDDLSLRGGLDLRDFPDVRSFEE